jgi:hypothetical protein
LALSLQKAAAANAANARIQPALFETIGGVPPTCPKKLRTKKHQRETFHLPL